MNRSSPPDANVLVLTQVFPRRLDDPMGAFLLHLASALSPRWVIDVIAPHAPGLSDAQSMGTVRVHRFRYAPERWERLAYSGQMHKLVRAGWFAPFLFISFNVAFVLKAISMARRADVIHAHWWLPGGLIGAIAALVNGKPLVITTHGTDIEQLRANAWARPLARWVFQRASSVTCGSEYLRNQLLELRVASAARIEVIPMPVNPIFVSEFQRTSNDVRIVLCVARLSAQKGIDTLIDAVAILRERGLASRLLIIGDGDQREALVRKAGALPAGTVQFLGMCSQEELPRYYTSCDVFVLPSIREGMGLVLAEALLCGVPVIATRSGGVTDIVQDGETGLLVPERDATALSDAIERMLTDRNLALHLARNGRNRVLERFTPALVGIQFTNVYKRALGQTAV